MSYRFQEEVTMENLSEGHEIPIPRDFFDVCGDCEDQLQDNLVQVWATCNPDILITVRRSGEGDLNDLRITFFLGSKSYEATPTIAWNKPDMKRLGRA